MNDEDFYEKLEQLLYEQNAHDVVYVYHILPDGQSRKPFLLRTEPCPDLFPYLQARYDGGHFRILIRRGQKMLLSGTVRIAPLPPQLASRTFSRG